MAAILLFSASFKPASNYFEWVLAKSVAQLGHRITVVTALDEAGPGTEAARVAAAHGISVTGLPVRRWRSTLFPRGGHDEVRRLASSHDCAVIAAPNLGFGYFYVKDLGSLPLALCFGETRDFRDTNPWYARIIKDRWYRRLFARGQKLVCNQEEALEILREIGLGKHERKASLIGLPFDEDVFHFDPLLAGPSVSGERRLVTVTRAGGGPAKPVTEWVAPVLEFLRRCPDWRYRFAGLDNDPPSARLRELVEASGVKDRVELCPVLPAREIMRTYHESDLALFFRPTIGIQQAMATGLPVVLPRFRPSVRHLVTEGLNGFWYESLEQLPETLAAAAGNLRAKRGELALHNAQWGGKEVARQILEGIL